jgi:aspartyl/glutamyl-tRNA(Asn/Gln) amidotransferase C subunit
MQRLVDDLLALSALESEHNPPHDDEFAVVPLILQLSADAKALSKGVHAVTLDIGDAATLTGDRQELASAFGNLVSNAVRYTPSGGTIGIGWRVEPDGGGVFSVTDTGIGIAPEHVPRLTERFYRVDRGRSRNTGGTGLGLAIVKHVLFRHQAELEIRSEPGVGSTFAVRLPPRRVRPVAVPVPGDAGDANASQAAARRAVLQHGPARPRCRSPQRRGKVPTPPQGRTATGPPMSLDRAATANIAHLARLAIAEDEAERVAQDLSRILDLVEQMSAVDTRGVVPMAHPLHMAQRLRPDVVTEPDGRAAFQAIAPATEAGLYLVPRVIE